MKKMTLLAVFCILLNALAFAQKPAISKAKTLPSEDTIQYSLGVYMMQQLFSRTGFVVTDATMFKKAIDDVIGKKKLMVDPVTTEARLITYRQENILEKNRRFEEMIINRVKKEKDFTALPSGVYYSVAKVGNGITPTVKDTVILNVICTLPDGTEVDNFNKTKRSYLSITSDMIPGLKDVLLHMREGSVVRAIVPASQAYGSAGTATIPPNSAVIYDLALLSVRPLK